MKISLLVPFLAGAFKNRLQVLVKGPPGCGKSDAIDQAADLIGYKHLERHLAVEDPTDVRGFPAKVDDGNGRVIGKWLPYEDLYQLIEAPVPTVVHLEDVGQATPAVQSAWMQLILRRRINGHALSPNVIFVASTNETGQCAGVCGMIEPFKSRWTTIVTCEQSLDDWRNWAASHNMPAWLIAYVGEVPEILNEFKPTKEISNSPCARNLEHVGQLDNGGLLQLESARGSIGESRAPQMLAFRDSQFALPDADRALLDPDNYELPGKVSFYWPMVNALSARVTQKNFGAAMKYVSRMGKANEFLLINFLAKRDPAVLSNAAFVAWARLPENGSFELRN